MISPRCSCTASQVHSRRFDRRRIRQCLRTGDDPRPSSSCLPHRYPAMVPRSCNPVDIDRICNQVEGLCTVPGDHKVHPDHTVMIEMIRIIQAYNNIKRETLQLRRYWQTQGWIEEFYKSLILYAYQPEFNSPIS